LITELQKLVAEFGDLPIVSYDGSRARRSVKSAIFADDMEKMENVIEIEFE